MELGADAVAALDKGDMLGAIRGLAEQIENGYAAARRRLEEVRGAGRPAAPAAPDGLVVCGMGGSAIGADLILASLPELRVPAAVVRGYVLPGWVTSRTLVVAASYSGGTEETLSCLDDALARGCSPVCITSGGRLAELAERYGLLLLRVPGGQQPRAALGSLAAPLLALLEAVGLCADQRPAVEETVALLRRGNDELGPAAPEEDAGSGPQPALPVRSLAKSLAKLALGRQVVVYGTGSTVAVARRWKGQVNENAKAPAYWNELPESDHNEIMAWASLPQVSAGTLAVFLNDAELDPRLLLCAELTAAVLDEHLVTVEHVWAHGASRLARLFSLVQIGDYASFYLALLYGVDPTPVEAIESFKAKLVSVSGQ